jgi:hypothetical protein
MNNLENRIRESNSFLTWISESELCDRGLGRVLCELDVSEMVGVLAGFEMPEKVSYVPSEVTLEQCAVVAGVAKHCFGEMPIQVGYCIGHNRKLNALEYHGGSEILVAATDLVLFLDSASRIVNNQYITKNLVACYVRAGRAVEIFGRTLHFAPLEVSAAGFRAAIILPKGTNLPLDEGPHGLLFAKNKWLVAHAESPSAQRGATIGIIGENISLQVPAG